MHIVTYKCIQKQYHVKKEKDYQRFTLNLGNKGSKHHRKLTGGCVRLALATSSQDIKQLPLSEQHCL
jgi:transcriptional regulator of NAD metabolism